MTNAYKLACHAWLVAITCYTLLVCSTAAGQMSDAEILEFVNQRQQAARITRKLSLMDYAAATDCRPAFDATTPGPHDDKAIHVYTNADGFAPMWDPYQPFPVGSLIVKEKLAPATPTEPELFTGMLKRAEGFAPEVGDWEFFTVDGTAENVTARGKLESCIGCHQEYKDSDFVTKSYAARAFPPFPRAQPWAIRQDDDWVFAAPICYSNTDDILLPAAWATVAGPKLSRPAAQQLWVSEKATELNSTPPEDLSAVGGPRLRFEPAPHKNTLGYWTVAEDSAHWQFQVPRDGRYEVSVLQGCGTGQGGSQVAVTVAGQELTFEVEDTGHFQNFVWRKIGSVELTASETCELTVQPQLKKATAVMDLRQIKLHRVDQR